MSDCKCECGACYKDILDCSHCICEDCNCNGCECAK